MWNIDANTIIQEGKHGENEAQSITAIDWNPTDSSEFAYTDNSGQFGLIQNINDADEDGPEPEDINELAEEVDFGDSKYNRKFQVFGMALLKKRSVRL